MTILCRRLHLLEIENQPWCPAPVRAAVQSNLMLTWQFYLFGFTKASSAAGVGDIIVENIPDAANSDFIDNCAEGGG